MTSSEYIDKFIILQAKKLQEQKFYLASVMVLTIGLEVMGGFFDKKPLKSPKQSKIRFKIATDKLLGGKYSALNKDDYLYETLRNQLVHSLLSGKYSIQLDYSQKLVMCAYQCTHDDLNKCIGSGTQFILYNGGRW